MAKKIKDMVKSVHFKKDESGKEAVAYLLDKRGGVVAAFNFDNSGRAAYQIPNFCGKQIIDKLPDAPYGMFANLYDALIDDKRIDYYDCAVVNDYNAQTTAEQYQWKVDGYYREIMCAAEGCYRYTDEDGNERKDGLIADFFATHDVYNMDTRIHVVPTIQSERASGGFVNVGSKRGELMYFSALVAASPNICVTKDVVILNAGSVEAVSKQFPYHVRNWLLDWASDFLA